MSDFLSDPLVKQVEPRNVLPWILAKQHESR